MPTQSTEELSATEIAAALQPFDIQTGDRLHGDLHGVIRAPAGVGARLPAVASRMQHGERAIIRPCRFAGFSLAGLRDILQSQPARI